MINLDLFLEAKFTFRPQAHFTDYHNSNSKPIPIGNFRRIDLATSQDW